MRLVQHVSSGVDHVGHRARHVEGVHDLVLAIAAKPLIIELKPLLEDQEVRLISLQ